VVAAACAVAEGVAMVAAGVMVAQEQAQPVAGCGPPAAGGPGQPFQQCSRSLAAAAAAGHAAGCDSRAAWSRAVTAVGC
jgi:hypothetical protein